MAHSDRAPPTSDQSRDDLVTYLAERLGVSREAALVTLGDWLVDFERVRDCVAPGSRRNRRD
jgi:hypothetical protein